MGDQSEPWERGTRGVFPAPFDTVRYAARVRLTPGQRLGPYEVLSVLGAGGMAEVYRARDGRLGREVALKVVNGAFSSSPELLKRFEQEARLAGSLNHPNLVAVYDVGQHDGVPYFVTELLEGESLRSRLGRGPVPLQTALDWGAQIARGLAAAHARGIVHRDVKPDNMFISPGGQVKLLDFGIAKLTESVSQPASHGLLEATVTPTGRVTASGAVLGTPGYMSPEQVRGEALDARSDVFSLGALLYELLGGGRAFPGASVVESGYAILHRDPAPLPPEVPGPVAQVVLRCLEKEPERRFQSASDLAFALDVVRGAPSSRAAPLLDPVKRFPRWVIAGGLLAVAAAVLLVTRAVLPRSAAPPLPTLEQVTHRWGTISRARFAPDGRVFFSAAFEGGPGEIYVRPPGSPEAQRLGLANSELSAVSSTGELALLRAPRFSLIFTWQGTLARVPGVGGTPRDVAEQVEYADWSPGGELAVVTGSGSGRSLEFPPGKTLFHTDGWISDPRFSSRGDRITFVHHPIFGDDMGEVMVVDLDGRGRTLTRRTPRLVGLAWAPGSREIWFTAGEVQRNTLRAVDLEGRERELYRAPSDIHLDDVAPDGSVLLSNQYERSEIVVEQDGRQSLLSWGDWTNTVVAFAPDRRALFSGTDPTPTQTGPQGSLVFLRGADGAPAQILGRGIAVDLSADGRWALTTSVDWRELEALPVGPGQPRTFPVKGLLINAARWFRDGKRILLAAKAPAAPGIQLYTFGIDDSVLRRVSADLVAARRILHLSPDGRLAATLDPSMKPLVIALADGSRVPIPGVEADAVPRGWAGPGELWMSRGGDRPPARARLFRVQLASGRTLEEREVGPMDATGANGIGQVLVSEDGRLTAMTFGRTLGQLFILRGLSVSSR